MIGAVVGAVLSFQATIIINNYILFQRIASRRHCFFRQRIGSLCVASLSAVKTGINFVLHENRAEERHRLE